MRRSYVLIFCILLIAVAGCATPPSSQVPFSQRQNFGSPLHGAAVDGDVSAAARLIAAGADVNARNHVGYAPLHYSLSVALSGLLIEKGADVNARNNEGRTPLHYAVWHDNKTELVSLLIEKGADLNARHEVGMTPLHEAVWFNSPNAVRLLLQKGANPFIKDNHGRTPLALARVKVDEHALNNAQPGRRQNYETMIALLGDAEAKLAHLKDAAAAAVAAAPKSPIRTVSPPSSARGKSDVDEIPAATRKANRSSYAVVIGIEKYRQKLPQADYAAADAGTVAEYLTKLMGYPEENIVTLTNENATNVDLVKYFERWLPNNVEGGSSVFIYYSGHGAPDPRTGEAYLVPYDGDPTFIAETGYPLERLYKTLGRLKAKNITVVLDSCFSGAGGRSVLAQGARPLVMNLKKSQAVSRNTSVLAAASGSQISSTYREKGHGLLTYFFLKGIKNEGLIEQDGSIAMGDLFTYLKPQVERIARKQYNNEQTPQLIESR